MYLPIMLIISSANFHLNIVKLSRYGFVYETQDRRGRFANELLSADA